MASSYFMSLFMFQSPSEIHQQLPPGLDFADPDAEASLNLSRTRGLLMGIYQPGIPRRSTYLKKPGGPLDRPTKSTGSRRPRSVARRPISVFVSRLPIPRCTHGRVELCKHLDWGIYINPLG